MQKKFLHILRFRAMTLIVILLAAVVSCTDYYDGIFSTDLSNPEYKQPEGAELQDYPNTRRVFVLFSFGYNNLSYDLYEDIEDMITGALPGYGFEEDVVLVLRHGTSKSHNYSQPSAPVLTHIYSKNDKIIRDTLKVYSDTTVAARKAIINEVLTIAKDRFPSKSYGMLISSHGTGWAPEGYCYSPPDKNSSIWSLNSGQYDGPAKYHEERPILKSIGAHYNGSPARAIEVDIPDLADAIPMHLDYILFDACFMGCVEVAYELKDKCDKICFSQTEVLAGGMDYKNLLSVLFDKDGIDLTICAENYFNMYKDQPTSYMRSATVSVVDCQKLEALAAIVARYSDEIQSLTSLDKRDDIQGYFQDRYSRNHGIFYDLEDILDKSGISVEAQVELEEALAECVMCKYATKSFLDEFKINTHCGLSMYLPDYDRDILNEYYKTLKWNKATDLIK